METVNLVQDGDDIILPIPESIAKAYKLKVGSPLLFLKEKDGIKIIPA